MSQFRDDWYELAPPWLRTGNAERYIYVLELHRDLLMEKANQAVKIRLPGQGDASQIPYLAHDRALIQGPNEPDAAFIARLKGAFAAWGRAGSAPAALLQLQAYTQGFQPGIPDTAAIMRIVSDERFRDASDSDGINSWYSVLAGDPIGQEPAFVNVSPHNFNWSGSAPGEFPATWRAWLILYQYAVDTGQTGASAVYASAGGGSFTEATCGEIVDGVWVPTTSGTPVNAPFVTVTGLSGLTNDNVGDIITFTGSAHRDNNGPQQIVQVLDATSCVIANKSNTTPDAGPLGWSIARYPWIPPALAMGSPGTVWGEGELAIPTADTGSNVRGLWRPTALAGVGERPTYAWGMRVSSFVIDTVRAILKTWKGGGTYYPNIVVCYDGPDGAYSPTSTYPFNPDGGFGEVGYLPLGGGVWVPTRQISSTWDTYCQGTGVANACGVENIS